MWRNAIHASPPSVCRYLGGLVPQHHMGWGKFITSWSSVHPPLVHMPPSSHLGPSALSTGTSPLRFWPAPASATQLDPEPGPPYLPPADPCSWDCLASIPTTSTAAQQTAVSEGSPGSSTSRPGESCRLAVTLSGCWETPPPPSLLSPSYASAIGCPIPLTA
jgi:hypothetical protein